MDQFTPDSTPEVPAYSDFEAEDIRITSAKNRRTFIIWLAAAIIVFILFIFIFPQQNITGGIMFLSILGSIILCFCIYKCFLYYKTWEVKFVVKTGRPETNFSVFAALAAIPAVILCFIISWRFNSGANDVLKETQEEAIATVIDGSSVRGRSFDFTDITVKFKTKAGAEITATEDISSYQFRDFYKGQKLNIVYSKTNPQNIDLLIDKENIRDLKNTAERDLEPADLIKLLSLDRGSVTPELNKINFGWVFDGNKSVWLNEKRDEVIQIDNAELTYITGKVGSNYTFPTKLLSMGFVRTNKDDPSDVMRTGEKIFEKDNYTTSVKKRGLGSTSATVITISKNKL